MFEHDTIVNEHYVPPKAIDWPETPIVMEALTLPRGEMTMRFHHFDARELPIVALNQKRIFFLAQPMMVGDRYRLSTDLDRILGR